MRVKMTFFSAARSCCRATSTFLSRGINPRFQIRRYTSYGTNSFSTDFIRSVFSRVATRYDLMNDLMSLGVHRIWKDIFVREAMAGFERINADVLASTLEGEQYKGTHKVEILDVAGGTGDIAFRLVEFANKLQVRDANSRILHVDVKAVPSVTILDPSEEMINIGKERCNRLGFDEYIAWVQANAEDMKLPDESYDLITVAFGVRNFTNVDQGLRECLRVLRPGGKLQILEFSKCQLNMLAALYDSWSNLAIPWLGTMVAGDAEAYKYLVDSIRAFPDQGTFAAQIKRAGFELVSHYNLTGGIVAIHSAYKPE